MRRILALIALLLLVVAPPVALLAWGFTDLGAIHLWSATDVRVLLAVLTLVGWLAWAAWMVALAIELVGALRGRRVRVALPGLSVPRALASALVHGPDLLLLDEPTVGQDREAWAAVSGVIEAAARAGVAVVAATHDDLLADLAVRRIVLTRGADA